jgi:iron complex outermembrane recepter protein
MVKAWFLPIPARRVCVAWVFREAHGGSIKAIKICGREALVALAALCASSAFAEENSPPSRRLEKIEVTGSLIKTVDGETALPVQIIRREEIERSGLTSAAELLNRVSANNSRGYAESGGLGDGGNPGFAGASLRGLGGGSTLVLLNGRRLSNYAFELGGANRNGTVTTASNGAVDLNSIPIAAVERVEIYKDGASSLYGTDAIGGVINFILRKDYRGFEMTTYYGATQQGGGGIKRATMTGGWGDIKTDKFNVFATVDYLKSAALRASDRAFSRSTYIPAEGIDQTTAASFPANIRTPRGLRNPYYPECVPPFSLVVPTSPAPLACWFDYAAVIDILNPSEKTAGVARATFQLSPDHQLYAQGLYTRNRFLFRVSPTPPARILTTPDPVTGVQPRITYPAGGPFYPGNGIVPAIPGVALSGDIDIVARTVTLGPRTDLVKSEAYGAVIGIKGMLRGWDYDAGLSYSKNRAADTFVGGYVSQNRFVAALATGLINPFGPSTPEGDALLRSTQISEEARNSSAETRQIDARFAKEILHLPAGPLALAFGAETRREAFNDHFGAVQSSGDVLGAAGPVQAGQGSRDINAVFGEINIPIAQGFETSLSARYDRYNDFGGTTNPKIAFRWQASKIFLARASYSTGFRAPTIPDLLTPQLDNQIATFATEDPARCSVTGLDSDCLNGFRTRTGGNPGLQPERSEQATLGFVFAPTPELSIAIEFWKINKSHVIGGVSEDNIFADLPKYEANGTVLRGPPDPAFPGLPGPIVLIKELGVNLGNQRTAGIDIDLTFKGPQKDIGRFGFSLNGTYVHVFKQQIEDGGPFFDNVGVFFNGAPVIRWRHFASLTWDYDPWSATLSQNFQSGYIDENSPNLNPPTNRPTRERRVASYETWDMQGQYAGIKHFKLTAGVRNLFDRAPPFSNQLDTFQVGYDPRFTDPRGRFYYVSATYALK